MNYYELPASHEPIAQTLRRFANGGQCSPEEWFPSLYGPYHYGQDPKFTLISFCRRSGWFEQVSRHANGDIMFEITDEGREEIMIALTHVKFQLEDFNDDLEYAVEWLANAS